MRRAIVLIFLLLIGLCLGVCHAEPAPYSSSEGAYVGSLGFFNDYIGDGWEQTCDYGWRIHPIYGDERFHSGIDIGADIGTPLAAVADGIVDEVRYQGDENSGYGLYVIVHYPNIPAPDGSMGMDIMYAHLSGRMVNEGDRVSRGQEIALVGNSGGSTGPHVHLEMRYAGWGDTVDPALYFRDLIPGAAGGGTPGIGTGRVPSGANGNDFTPINFELKADLVAPIREIFEAIIKAATEGLRYLAGGAKKLFMILLTIDLALGLIFYNIDRSMHERTGLISYLAFKFLFYGFLLFFLTHWNDYVGNFSKGLFTDAAVIMSGRSSEEIAAAISSPTDIMAKGLHIVSPIFSQLLKDTSSTLGIGNGIVIILAFAILFCFLVIGWHIAQAYIEFYLMVLFSFTTFVFSAEKHTRLHAENGINGIIASSINLMFFCFFAIILQGVMADLTVDAVFTTTTRTGSEFAFHHPSTSDDENAGIPPPPEGLPIFMAKIRSVETGGEEDPYHAWSEDYDDDGMPNSYGAYQIQPENWMRWTEEAYASGVPLIPDGGGYPTDGTKGVSRFSWRPEHQDMVASYQMMEYYKEFGCWRDVAIAWNGGPGAVGQGWTATDVYWAKVSGASLSRSDQMPVKRVVINTTILLKLFLVVLMFMFIGSRIGSAIMNSFGSRGFTFRSNY